MTTEEIVEGELLPDVIENPPPNTLFGTRDPKVALQRMSDIASVLVDVIKDRRLYARISGHEHITAEGWTTLGGMLGVVPVVCWTKPNESGDGYLARVEARTLDGRVVGAAESECSRAERRWKTADPYAIRSMAQTRAIGRALRAPLGQIVVLAGYDPTGAEEIPTLDGSATRTEPEPPTDPYAAPVGASSDQLARITALIRSLQHCDPEIDWKTRTLELAGVPARMLTFKGAVLLLETLEAELAKKVDET